MTEIDQLKARIKELETQVAIEKAMKKLFVERLSEFVKALDPSEPSSQGPHSSP